MRLAKHLLILAMLGLAPILAPPATAEPGESATVGACITGPAEASDPLAGPLVHDRHVRMFYTNTEAGHRYERGLYPDEFWIYHAHFDLHPEYLSLFDGATHETASQFCGYLTYFVVHDPPGQQRGNGIHWYVAHWEPTHIDDAMTLAESQVYDGGRDEAQIGTNSTNANTGVKKRYD